MTPLVMGFGAILVFALKNTTSKNMRGKTKIGLIWSAVLVAMFVMSQSAWAQLNCKTIKAADGRRTTCYHANKQVSTTESWDQNEHWGKFEAWNSKGERLVEFELRKIGGHAGVDVSYYPNGQVSKLDYSSAPDGGIQYWNYIYTYNEEGVETSRVDLSRPDGFPHLYQPERELFEEVQNPRPWLVNPQPVEEKKVPFTVHVVNTSNREIALRYLILSDSSFQDVQLKASSKEPFADTLEIKQGQHTAELVEWQITGRLAKRFEVMQLLSNDKMRVYAIVRRNTDVGQPRRK